MALYYTMDLRGTIFSKRFAVHTHWRADNILGAPTEAELCQTIAQMGYDFWNTSGKAIVTGNVVLTKVVVQAYDDPTGFYEMPAAIIGQRTGAAGASFLAKGWRQFRTNQDFRTATHRFPEVREENMSGNVWVDDAQIDASMITAVTIWLGNTHSVSVVGGTISADIVPVLVRTQYTTKDPVTGTKTVTYLNPHEISDVGTAGFYGITTQNSRKDIIPI
jgi:hypothetical protein